MRYLFNLLTPIIILALVSLSLFLLNERQIFDIRTLVRIDPVPHTQELIDQKQYADAYEYLNYFMAYEYVQSDPKAQALSHHIDEVRSSYDYKSDKILEGILKGTSDETEGQISAIASDFLVVGDIRDLAIQGTLFAKDEEVDTVIVALSTLGLVATASTLYSFGATTPVKGTLSLLKYGKRVGKLPNWLNKQLIREAKVAKETKSLSKVQEVLNPITDLYEKVGMKQTLDLLKQTKNLDDLKGIVKFSSRFGKESSILLKTTKNQARYYAKAMPNVTNREFLYAATYGERGLQGLKRLGVSKFMKRTKIAANLSKTVYKGNLDALLTYLLKTIPTTLLYGIVLLGLLYFSRKFVRIYWKIFN